ncbi:hypothetical protein K2173_026375 [Erythroxylum novogranatense]|uniref:RING-type E3 ubiquitin transferase n=1 Tax=Erythroxylum novogranatense TaxID=1862640 RepID=A0AAV8SP09_9ROSI|nr:hypothetical protein K2173_026375 [Erythroxylum novogranatense]
MPVFTEHINPRKPRNQFRQELAISSETHPSPLFSRTSKSTLSSLFLSPFSTNAPRDPTNKKKAPSFRALGCTAAAQQVSVPAVIRSSAAWERKKLKKKKNPQRQKRRKDDNNKRNHHQSVVGDGNSGDSIGSLSGGSCMVIQDVWCGPAMGLSADAVVGSVDCVVARRNVHGRSKIDGDKMIQRERERERERSCLPRRAAVNPDTLAFLDMDPVLEPFQPEPEVFGARYYRHYRHTSPDGLAEVLMLQNSFTTGGRLDQFSDWRLDIDDMSYEELLELGDKIGYVCTGLKEDEITRSIRKIKLSILNDRPSHWPTIVEKKCSVCQDEYEADDELGKLDCGHSYHIQCIKQWLEQKNTCPVCKSEPVGRG